jgi:hypothetical protein
VHAAKGTRFAIVGRRSLGDDERVTVVVRDGISSIFRLTGATLDGNCAQDWNGARILSFGFCRQCDAAPTR